VQVPFHQLLSELRWNPPTLQRANNNNERSKFRPKSNEPRVFWCVSRLCWRKWILLNWPVIVIRVWSAVSFGIDKTRVWLRVIRLDGILTKIWLQNSIARRRQDFVCAPFCRIAVDQLLKQLFCQAKFVFRPGTEFFNDRTLINTVTVSFNTIMVQITEIPQRIKTSYQVPPLAEEDFRTSEV